VISDELLTRNHGVNQSAYVCRNCLMTSAGGQHTLLLARDRF